MIRLNEDIFIFNDSENKINSYLILNSLDDIALINPTTNNIIDVIKRIQLTEETINIVFYDINKNINEVQMYLESIGYKNYYIYTLKEVDVKNNIVIKEKKLEIENFIFNIFKIKEKDSVCIKYKEYLFIDKLEENGLNTIKENNMDEMIFICSSNEVPKRLNIWEHQQKIK